MQARPLRFLISLGDLEKDISVPCIPGCSINLILYLSKAKGHPRYVCRVNYGQGQTPERSGTVRVTKWNQTPA